MNYKLVYTFLILSSLSLISCDRPKCKNKNPVFETNEPNSKKYKDELVNQLNRINQSELTYWLQSMMIKMEKKPYTLMSKEMNCVQFYI